MLQEHFSRESEKNGFLNYRKNLWDNQMDKKQEEGLVIDFENIPENINAFLLYITLNDISKRSSLNYGLVELQDFHSQAKYESFNFELPEGATDEIPEAQEGEKAITISQIQVPYYFYRNLNKEWVYERFDNRMTTQNLEQTLEKLGHYHELSYFEN